MLFRQYYLNCLAQASYLIADAETRRAVVVDPRRDVDVYLADAARDGLTITHAILTHFHADFVAGHIELRERAGARIALGAQARADYDFQPLQDGTVLSLGAVRLQVLETPGHTPEAISLLVFDAPDPTAAPWAVLTGDTLFIGDVGRPDLMASKGVSADDLGSRLFDSLHDKLLTLPDATRVYPGHGAGSLCGRALGNETVSSMGEQRRYNYALQPMTREAFITLVTADQPAAPEYFRFDADLNRRERPTLESALRGSLHELSLPEVLRQQQDGAQVLDVREAGAFAAAHLPGAINVGLDGQFASWAGTVLDYDRPILLVADLGQQEEAAVRLGRIGYDNVTGCLDGGMAALADRDDLLDRVVRYAPATLRERLAEPDPPLLLDVRTAAERAEGAIRGSLHVPLGELRRRVADLPRGRAVVIYCGGGYRSAIAASLLRQSGLRDVADLAGGYGAWAATAPTDAV